jgi:3-hydroxy-9,10-secoandrosta-1,3,5(10)-triene-9,17-dione monooxygenase
MSVTEPRATTITQEEAVARAGDLVPRLRERAARAEELRRLPDETLRDFQESGLLRLMQPKRWGGYELGFDANLACSAELGRACGSSAWIFSFLVNHTWFVSLWPEQAQQEVWGAGPDVLISTSVTPGHEPPDRADGGYRLHGKWPFASGCDLGEWHVVGGLLFPEDHQGPPEMRWFLLPRGDYEIEDDWDSVAMRGSGSKTVVIRDAFVPEHRSVNVADLLEGQAPGTQVNTATQFRLPLLSCWPLTLIGPGLGVAQGALETFQEAMRAKFVSFTQDQMNQYLPTQLRVAESAAEIDCARLLIRESMQTMMTHDPDGGRPLTLEQRARNWRNFAYSLQLCTRAVDRLFEASGGGGLYNRNPIQRYWRDIHGVAAHGILHWDPAAEHFGRLALGLGPKGFFR